VIFLVFGLYPEVLTHTNRDERFEDLREISESYLMKDIIEISQSLKINHENYLDFIKIIKP
jgi:hypothetical protein